MALGAPTARRAGSALLMSPLLPSFSFCPWRSSRRGPIVDRIKILRPDGMILLQHGGPWVGRSNALLILRGPAQAVGEKSVDATDSFCASTSARRSGPKRAAVEETQRSRLAQGP